MSLFLGFFIFVAFARCIAVWAVHTTTPALPGEE